MSNEPVSSYKGNGNDDIFYPSGAAVMFRAEALNETGLFYEQFWMFNEDQDLGWRIWLDGYRCVLAFDAVVYHKYDFSRNPDKLYWIDRNRILSSLINFKLITLFSLMPAFFAAEIGLLLISRKKELKAVKRRVYRYLLTPSTWVWVLKARIKTQRLRKIRDKDILMMMQSSIEHQEFSGRLLRIANPLMSAYFGLVRFITFW